MSGPATLDDLEPRIRRMVELIVRNRQAICRPAKGTLELHFRGGGVEAKLIGIEAMVMDDKHGEPPGAAQAEES